MSPIIPTQGLHFPNDYSGNQNRYCALRGVILDIGWSSGWPFLDYDEGRDVVVLPHEFSAIAVSCLEFLHALDLPEFPSYSLCCSV